MSLHNHPQVDPMNNAQWISQAETPDPSPLPEVLGWRLLVRPVEIRPKTKGGILLPDIVKDDAHYLNTVGRVLSVGPLAFRQEDYHLYTTKDAMGFPAAQFDPWVKVGDFVLYGKNAGKRIVYKGVKLVLLNDDHVTMRVDNPDTLDPMAAFLK